MKRISIGFLVTFLLITIFSACKEDNYIDWKVKNELWLEKNKTQPGVITTASGLQYKIIDDGWSYNRKPNIKSIITVTFTGVLIDGSTFESGSYYSYYLYSRVKGWQEALPKIHDGGSILLYVPSNLGEGKEPTNTQIPPHSTLIYKIDLISSEK